MPSTKDAGSSPPPVSTHPAPAGAPHLPPAQQLAQACRASWIATLALTTASTVDPAPASRLLPARRTSRISRNFDRLARRSALLR